MFDDPVSWTIEHGYPVLFGMLLFSGLGVPIPEDVPLIAAGVLARHGGMGVVLFHQKLKIYRNIQKSAKR